MADTTNPMAEIKTTSGKIEVYIEELQDRVVALDAERERVALTPAKEYPFILNAGRHMKYNANTLMRNPEWNADRRACTVAMNPEDAAACNLSDGQKVKVITDAGSETGELETTDQVRAGTILIPHGFGLSYAGQVYGMNVNRLTKNTHRDPIGTPLHKYVQCRIEAV
jgi:anaerobic selenocysteine-containing dehydrogenase